eukprot:1299889-Amphidinium_carterae.1
MFICLHDIRPAAKPTILLLQILQSSIHLELTQDVSTVCNSGSVLCSTKVTGWSTCLNSLPGIQHQLSHAGGKCFVQSELVQDASNLVMHWKVDPGAPFLDKQTMALHRKKRKLMQSLPGLALCVSQQSC